MFDERVTAMRRRHFLGRDYGCCFLPVDGITAIKVLHPVQECGREDEAIAVCIQSYVASVAAK